MSNNAIHVDTAAEAAQLNVGKRVSFTKSLNGQIVNLVGTVESTGWARDDDGNMYSLTNLLPKQNGGKRKSIKKKSKKSRSLRR